MRLSALFLLLLSATFLLPSASLPSSQNITTLLSADPPYSSFNSLLSQYGVAAQINSRTTLTVLCPANSILDPVVSSLGSSPDRQTLFNILSYHVLLDYEDPSKLKSLPHGSSLFATLFQTTGLASGTDGFVNISFSKGSAHVGHPSPGSSLKASIGSPIALFPYNISLLSIDSVLIPSGVGSPSPAPAPVNLTQIISQAGNYSDFVSLIVSTGVDKILQAHDTPPGVTIFVPTNAAFDMLPAGSLANLSNAQKVALLEFHSVGSFYPLQELATANGAQSTLASGSGGAAYTFTVSQNKAGAVVIDTGFNKVPIASTIYSNNPVAIFCIDSVLLPSDIFGSASPSPTAAPGPAPASAPTPSSVSSPAPAPASTPTSTPTTSPSPSPSIVPVSSPPAPPPGSPASSIGAAPGPEASSPHSSTSFASPVHVHDAGIAVVLVVVAALLI